MIKKIRPDGSCDPACLAYEWERPSMCANDWSTPLDDSPSPHPGPFCPAYVPDEIARSLPTCLVCGTQEAIVAVEDVDRIMFKVGCLTPGCRGNYTYRRKMFSSRREAAKEAADPPAPLLDCPRCGCPAKLISLHAHDDPATIFLCGCPKLGCQELPVLHVTKTGAANAWNRQVSGNR